MAESKKLIILQTLTDLLKTIDGTGDYDNDVSETVFRGRTLYSANDPLPMISILESPRPGFGQYAGEDNVRTEIWSLLIQGWAMDDAENPTDNLYTFMSDVELCLKQIVEIRDDGSGRPVNRAVYLLGSRVVSFTFGPGVVRPAQEGVSAKACFFMPVSIRLAGDVG